MSFDKKNVEKILSGVFFWKFIKIWEENLPKSKLSQINILAIPNLGFLAKHVSVKHIV